LFGQPPRQVLHAAGPVLLPAPDGSAHDLWVEQGHRVQGAGDIAVGREPLDARPEPAAQMLSRVRVSYRLDHFLKAGWLQQVGAERVEQPSPGAEDQVHGRPGHARVPCDLIDAHRLGRRVAQPGVEGVEDPAAGLFRRLCAQALLVLAGHEPDSSISLDIMSSVGHYVW
jgi:hypothetical protein